MSANRYGFNGKENDNEVKGEGNQIDFGMRVYDPRIGKFLSVDPLAQKMPDMSPFTFSNNSPIFFIDPDGAEPIPVSSKFFIIFANKLGIRGNKAIGEYFEKLVLASLQTTEPLILHNTSLDYPSPVRTQMNGGLPGAVRPDGVTKRAGIKVGTGVSFDMAPAFYEAKVTSATITKRYRKAQITGMIDAVANQKREPDEVPSLTLITTVNTVISKDILQYATDRGVMLYNAVAAFDDETHEFIVSERALLNPSPGAAVLENIRRPFNWDKFDEFKGVDPFDPKYRRNAPESTKPDPDPAMAEDK